MNHTIGEWVQEKRDRVDNDIRQKTLAYWPTFLQTIEKQSPGIMDRAVVPKIVWVDGGGRIFEAKYDRNAFLKLTGDKSEPILTQKEILLRGMNSSHAAA